MLDVAFAADGLGTSFDEITRPFIEGLGVAWQPGSITTTTSDTPTIAATRALCWPPKPSTAPVPRWSPRSSWRPSAPSDRSSATSMSMACMPQRSGCAVDVTLSRGR